MNLGKSLLVLKSPIFVEILSFIWWWSRFPTLLNRTDNGEGWGGRRVRPCTHKNQFSCTSPHSHQRASISHARLPASPDIHKHTSIHLKY